MKKFDPTKFNNGMIKIWRKKEETKNKGESIPPSTTNVSCNN
jgi:hypothetical protein